MASNLRIKFNLYHLPSNLKMLKVTSKRKCNISFGSTPMSSKTMQIVIFRFNCYWQDKVFCETIKKNVYLRKKIPQVLSNLIGNVKFYLTKIICRLLLQQVFKIQFILYFFLFYRYMKHDVKLINLFIYWQKREYLHDFTVQQMRHKIVYSL